VGTREKVTFLCQVEKTVCPAEKEKDGPRQSDWRKGIAPLWGLGKRRSSLVVGRKPNELAIFSPLPTRTLGLHHTRGKECRISGKVKKGYLLTNRKKKCHSRGRISSSHREWRQERARDKEEAENAQKGWGGVPL